MSMSLEKSISPRPPREGYQPTMKVLITGAAVNASRAVCRAVARGGFELRLADAAGGPGRRVSRDGREP